MKMKTWKKAMLILLMLALSLTPCVSNLLPPLNSSFKELKEIYAYERILGQEKLLVVCNFAGEAMDLEIPAEFVEKSAKLLISNYPGTKITDTLHLQPYEARVYHIEG